MIELKDTSIMMESLDYTQRFIAEYVQLQIRYNKLFSMTQKYENGTLDFKPDTPLEVLNEQLDYMGSYIDVLQRRAEYEHIKLPM